jgi:uncharacterized protein YkwD
MRFGRTLAVCSLVVSVPALPAQATAAPVAPKVVGKINQKRQKQGVRALRSSPALMRSSHRYACRMLARDYFGHMARVSAPRKFHPRGEALAMTSGHRPRWKVAWRSWIHSSAHRKLILSGRFSWVGVGSCKGRMNGSRATTWVVHVGRLR